MRVVVRRQRGPRKAPAETIVFIPQRQLTATAVGVSLLCGYELAAVITGKVPTVSAVCRRHRVAEAAFLGWLLVHLHAKVREAGD